MVIMDKLENGLQIVLEPMPYLRSISIGVWVKAGAVNETKENNGISHMIEHMMFKGTENRTAKEIAEEMIILGGNMNAFTSEEFTAFYLTVLDEHLEKAVCLLADMLQRSLFEEKELEKEKGIVLEEIQMYEDSPEDLVHEMLEHKIWKDHPLGYLVSGEAETVKKLERQQIIAFMRKHYTAENMVISIAGHLDAEKTRQMLERMFGGMERGKPVEYPQSPVYHRAFYIQEREIEQVHMNLAFPCIKTVSEERYTMFLLNAILGESENSRLFQRVREELGLAYSIFSYANTFQTAGLLHIDAVSTPENLKQVYDNTIQVIRDLKQGGIPKEELAKTKEMVKAQLIIGNEYSRNRTSTNGGYLINKDKVISLEEVIENINRVTEENIMEFLFHYLKLEHLSLSLVGNLSCLSKKKEDWLLDG